VWFEKKGEKKAAGTAAVSGDARTARIGLALSDSLVWSGSDDLKIFGACLERQGHLANNLEVKPTQHNTEG
jgi:hypothetical protein